MSARCLRQLCLLHVVWCLWFCRVRVEAYPSPFKHCEDGMALTKVPDIQSDVKDMVWRDQNEEQVQNVFKRFLFHYSKAHNSMGSVQHESHSVHPLMRLSPKLSQRRKKQLLLLKIRAIQEGAV